MLNVTVWDIETVPDLKGYAAANGHTDKSDDEVRAELGDKFPKYMLRRNGQRAHLNWHHAPCQRFGVSGGAMACDERSAYADLQEVYDTERDLLYVTPAPEAI